MVWGKNQWRPRSITDLTHEPADIPANSPASVGCRWLNESMSDEPQVSYPYPHEWEADVVLRDGSVAHVRPITPDDADALQAFHVRQSEESIYLRFFAPIKRLSDRDLKRFTNVDYRERVALVATLGDDIIGIGRYDRLGGPDAPSAEVAFNISDHHQGKGIGSVMLEHLAAIGAEAGVERFVAEVLPQNRKMIQVFIEAGYDVSRNFDDGLISVQFSITPNEKSLAVRLAREQRSESSSVRALLTPESVAVVGVSRTHVSAGGQVLRNIMAGGYGGKLFVVHPEATEIEGLKAYPSVQAIGEPVDLCIIAVPAKNVLDVVRDCAAVGTKALLVMSAGFAEAGEEGARLQNELLTLARRHGMRVVGPNSFGLVNNRADVKFNATTARDVPPAGHLGLFAQSGALGIAVLERASRRGLGLSDFASAGNRIDVSGNDLLQYWIDDDETHAVGLYLESVGNPRKFSRISRQLAMRKPVIVVKSEVSAFGVPPGHRVRKTHTGPEAFREMLRQTGVIRVENMHQLFDVAQLVINQPLPKGRRIGIVANSDALGAIAGDAALGWNLDVTHGPVAMVPESTNDDFRDALVAAFEDDAVDSVIACFIPPLMTGSEDVAKIVAEVSARYDKPCISTLLGLHGASEALTVRDENGEHIVPAYPMPEDGIRALASVTNYAGWRGRDQGTPVAAEGIDRRAIHEMIANVLEESPEGRELTDAETTKLLSLAGLTVWPSRRVRTSAEAVEAASEFGFPVVVKSIAPQVRTQVASALRADLRSPMAVIDAFESLSERLAEYGDDQFVVQKMATPGIGCVITSTEDDLFGPVVSFSVSGPPTQLLGDIGYRIPPLTTVDVSELVSSIKAWPLLDGSGGTPPVDRAVLEDIVSRVAILADENPDIARLELNPVSTHPGGADILEAHIWIAPASTRTDGDRRALTAV